MPSFAAIQDSYRIAQPPARKEAPTMVRQSWLQLLVADRRSRMKRRSALKVFGGAGAGFAAAMAGNPGPLQAAQAAARRGLPPLKITDVKVILTQPGPDQLVI